MIMCRSWSAHNAFSVTSLFGIGSRTARVHFPEDAATEAAHKRRDINMHTKRMLAGALTSLSLAALGLSLGTGTALALPSQPHEWCPGMSMNNPPGPGAGNVWDMNVCHTWQYVKPGMGNVAHEVFDGPLDPVTYRATGYKIVVEGSDIWEGPNMPPGAARECGHDGFTGIPVSC
jgi:hypothetical protein